jgi:hypothetical protein
MAYSDFSLKDAAKLLNLVIQERAGLFAEILDHPISAHLQETLRDNLQDTVQIDLDEYYIDNVVRSWAF